MTVDNLMPKDLIERYAQNLPRYTSYPTAVEFHQDYCREAWQKEIELITIPENKSSFSLYIHLPFCHSLCYFCACHKVIPKGRDLVGPYTTAVDAELAAVAACLKESPEIHQMHWGGGTPNFLSPPELEGIFKAVATRFPIFTDNADISIELDPRTVTSQHLETLAELAFNRISLGVQDLDPNVQQAINRIQSFEQLSDICGKARTLGFSGINLDLIYGLPLQTLESFSKTIDAVASLRPDRVAVYGYAHVTWISKTQRVFDKLPKPASELRLELLKTAVERLLSEGYVYIGMDHFALPTDSMALAMSDGTLHRNFMGYTTHRTDTLLGVGMSAISSTRNAYAQNFRGLERYISTATQNGFCTERGLQRSFEDSWRDSAIQSVMCSRPLNFDSFLDEWGINLRDRLDKNKLTKLAEDQLIEFSSYGLMITEKGRYFLRNIAAMFDSYLAGHDSNRTFSQAV